jgi:hypothetical protein
VWRQTCDSVYSNEGFTVVLMKDKIQEWITLWKRLPLSRVTQSNVFSLLKLP